MAATGPKISIYRNDSWTGNFSVKLSGVAVNISGWEIKMMVKASLSDADNAALISADGVISGDGSTGLFSIDIPKEDTAVTVGSGYKYDIQCTYGGTHRFTILGAFEVLQDVRTGA